MNFRLLTSFVISCLTCSAFAQGTFVAPTNPTGPILVPPGTSTVVIPQGGAGTYQFIGNAPTAGFVVPSVSVNVFMNAAAVSGATIVGNLSSTPLNPTPIDAAIGNAANQDRDRNRVLNFNPLQGVPGLSIKDGGISLPTGVGEQQSKTAERKDPNCSGDGPKDSGSGGCVGTNASPAPAGAPAGTTSISKTNVPEQIYAPTPDIQIEDVGIKTADGN